MNRKLVALVVGNAKYPGAELKNASNDAKDLGEALKSCGFGVTTLKNAIQKELAEAIQAFQADLAGNDVGLFYFAGHGLQIEGENFVTSVDTNFSSEIDVQYSSLSLNKIISIMEKSGTTTNLIILDACRNNPWVRGWNRGMDRGLAPVYAPKGTLVAFATSPGETARDGGARNGRYTEALLQHILMPDVTVEDMFKRVRNSLAASTQGKQTSWEHTSLSGDFFFNISLGNRIDSYGKEALADKYFVLKKTKLHEIITGLKSNTWNSQNSAIDALSPSLLEKADKDTLFVLGRNLYQAADGHARHAISFIKNFRSNVDSVSAENRHHVLAGLLFEIFFNSEGELRSDFKMRCFNDVFVLQKYADLADGFDFIAECLSIYPNRFYKIPGKNRAATVALRTDVMTTGEHKVVRVFFSGADVLQKEEDPFSSGKERFRSLSFAELTNQISHQMVIPKHLLNVTADFETEDYEQMLLPQHATLRKG